MNIVTGVTAPSTLTVGGNGVFTATISNQDPAGTAYPNSVMKVVLPVGVFYDPSVGVTRDLETARVSGVPVPEIGDGVTISTETVTDAAGEHQVVVFTFDSLESVATMGQPTVADPIGGGFRYNIPTQVLAQAYTAGVGEVPVTSWAYTDGAPYATMAMSYYGPFFSADTYDFGQTPNSVIAKDVKRSVVVTSGGLLVGKQVRESSDADWSISTTIGGSADWRVYVTNALVNPITDVVLFDRLPFAGDDRGSEFDATLTGPVTGIPAGGTIEYSTDATSATDGTWSTEPVGATAFRIAVPSIAPGANFTIEYTTSVPAGTTPDAVAANNLQATGTYNNGLREFESNLAYVSVRGGAFSVTKSITGDAAESVPADTEFTVEYSYGDPVTTGTLTVLADGTVVTSDELPLGSEITLSEPEFPTVDGVTWGTPAFVIDGGEPTTDATFVIAPGVTVAVQVINTANVAVGDFSVTKAVTGTAASSVPTDTEFTVAYSYGDVAGTLTVRADGTVVTSDLLPVGTEVTLTEVDLPVIAGVTWGTPQFTVGEDEPSEAATFTIGDGTTTAITVTNTANVTAVAPAQKPDTTQTSVHTPLASTGFGGVSGVVITLAVGLLIAGAGILLGRRVRAQR